MAVGAAGAVSAAANGEDLPGVALGADAVDVGAEYFLEVTGGDGVNLHFVGCLPTGEIIKMLLLVSWSADGEK